MLYGRDSERERLRALVRGVPEAEQSFALLVEGAAGIGKTTLLDEVLADAAGARVLRAAGHEAEAEIPYAGLSALLPPVLPLREQLPDSQRAALGGALALEEAPPRDRFALPVALLGLLAAAAEERPLLVVVDDFHWLDAASREALVFASQRLGAEAIGILLAARDGQPEPLAPPGLERLRLAPLGEAPARALLGEGERLAPEVTEALLAASAGNPLALRELPRSLSPEQRAGEAPLAHQPAAGGEVQAAFAAQLAGLPAATATALLILAAGEGAPAAAVEDALARREIATVALEPAVAAGFLVAGEQGPRFRHPLLASAAYHAAPSGERRAAHAALAAVLEEPARRAWQLAAAAVAPDPEAAAALAAVATEARAAGAHADAARAFARAAELAPAGPERAGMELQAARDHAVAGHGAAALELAERAAVSAGDDALRDAAERLRAHLLMRTGDPVAGIASLEALSARAAARGEQASAARLLLEASLVLMFAGQMKEMVDLGERARVLAAGTDEELTMLAGVVSGEGMLALGRTAEGEGLLLAGEPLLLAADPRSEVAEVACMAAMCGLWIERFELSDRVLSAMVARAREASAVGRVVYPLVVRTQLHWRRGRWAAAYADAEECTRLARESGQSGVLSLALAMLGRAEGGIGRLAEAREHAREGVALGEQAAGEATVLHALAALGFTELSSGRADLALAPLQRAAEISRRLGHGEPAISLHSPDLVEALARVGRAEEAGRELEWLAAGAECTGSAWANATAARGRLLLAADGEVESEAEAAFAWHDRVEMPFERARTELALGERLRRARRRAAARGWLERAQRGFERLGAEPWAARARTELRATGGRAAPHAAAPVEELTPHELQVALLVAEGRTNREVGAALFLSPKTIEHHLGSIYRKLGLRSRVQLAALLADQLPSPGRTAPVS